MPRRLTAVLLVCSLILTLVAVVPPERAAASPVALDEATYALYGRVFPDPHGCVKGAPGKSPYAQGRVCAAQFVQFDELIAGLRFLDSKFGRFMQIFELPAQSAGLPTNTLDRKRSPLYAVRVTDESVTGTKKRFAFSLSIHGVERAGVEGGTRAIEDLVTWGTSEPGRPLLETVPDSAVTVGAALAQSEVWFFYPNPDGWRRGDVSQAGLAYQRYNGNGVDLNRDWPTNGYTFRPYTPASEPESKAFADFFTAPERAGAWAGAGDLHGMLQAVAFTFTMLPAGEYDYARNGKIVASARRIQQDAFPRLSWFPIIRPYSQTPSATRPHAQQWGTTWDTINYTVTGSLGDWMANPIGLDAEIGLNNEMWVSHLAPNNTFAPDLEQAHIDGNKGLIYAQIESSFRQANRSFPLDGRLAYVDHGRVFSHPGSAVSADPNAGLPPQTDLSADLTSTGVGDVSFEFDVMGPEQGVYNGGLTAQVTYTNAQAISPGATAAVFVEKRRDEHGGEEQWETVNQDFNQDFLYLQAGMTVNVNAPGPDRWRVRLQNAPAGVHRVSVDFTSGPSWPDPGQRAYRATSTKFFGDLGRSLPADRQPVGLTPEQVLAGTDLSGFDTLVVVNDALPGAYDAAPSGPPQPTESFTMVAPIPEVSTVTHEFDVLGTYNNVAMTLRVEWDIPSDYDLYLDRRSPSGSWVELGSSADFVNNAEQIEISGMLPGRYRARILNFAGVAQPLRGTVTYSTSGITPPEYATTRSAADRDAYYARLRAFVESGGNLVLTDGAARALPHLGIGSPADVRALLVYAPFIGFTTDGADSTYADPLARNVNQPGAAEGAGRRHQTVEPVPLGYSIQDRNGNNQGHSFTWIVTPEAWTSAGGRIAGTTGGGVSLGEVSKGAGRIRVVGGLLPDPEVRYDHPYGLASYALTYSGWQLFENAVQWQRPLPDLALAASDISFSSAKIVGGDRVAITATVRNPGTAPASNVAVRFSDNGTQIGSDQRIASIPAGGSGTASVLWETKHLKGTRTITVTADPANAIRESNETNNTASGTVEVRGNKVANSSFEQSASGSSPDSWSGSGGTTYAQGGTDGDRSVTADLTGAWTSDAIEVVAGRAYGLAADVSGGGSIAVEQLSSAGLVLGKLAGVTTFVADAGVAKVRVVLAGGLTGIATFDRVRLWEE